MRQSRVPKPGRSAYRARNFGRAIVALHMSAPTASLYGNFNTSSFSGVCGSSTWRKSWHPRRSWCPPCLLDAKLLYHRLNLIVFSKLNGERLHSRLVGSKDVVHAHKHHNLQCTCPGFQNLATARIAHAMSGRVIVTVDMSVPTVSWYGNFNTPTFFSGV